jgi:hypothetical protein
MDVYGRRVVPVGREALSGSKGIGLWHALAPLNEAHLKQPPVRHLPLHFEPRCDLGRLARAARLRLVGLAHLVEVWTVLVGYGLHLLVKKET